MIFNYDKTEGTFNNGKNLSEFWESIKDFFTKKQDVVKNYNPTNNEQEYFKRLINDIPKEADLSSDEYKNLASTWANELDEGNNKLIEYNSNTELGSQNLANFAQSQQTVIQGTTKFGAALKTAGNVAKTFVGTLGNMAIAMAASWAIGKVFEAIDDYRHRSENIIKAGQEAKDSIDSTFKSFEEGKQSIMDLGSSFGDQTEQIKNTGDAIDQVAEKYVELRKGVNQNTNENVSLSTDEYQQYIDLSSKLASQFPGLVAGYDSQGNAVLNLASNADKAADSIRNLYEAQVSSANVDMGKNLQATYDGVVTQTSQYAEDIQKKRDELAQLDIDISENKRSILTYGSNNFEVQNLYGDKENVITDVLKENGLYKENTGDDGSIWNFYAEGLADKSKQEIDRMNEQITAGMESYYLTLESQRSQLQSEINSYDLMIEDQWRSMAQSLGNYLQTSKSFNELDDSLQSAFLANISNLDLTALNDPDGEYKGQVLDFLYGEFLGPMSQFSTDVQESLAKALQIDPSKLTIDEYRSQVDEAFKDAFGNDTEEKKELQERFKNAYGIDSSIEDMEDNAERLKEAYADFPNASDFIDQMQTGDLSIAAQLIDNGSVDIEKGTDGLVSAIERYKKTVAESTDGPTLSSILGDSDNEISSSIDSLQSDISSLSDTLTKLKTGEFKDSDLTDLIQQFPQLASGTDDLQKSISNLKVSKVTDSIKKIDDAMVGASKEEMEYAKALKGSILKEADLSDIDAATAKQEIEKLFKNAYSSAPQTVAENMAKGFINSYSSYMTSDTGAQAMLKAVEQNIGNITSTGFDWGKEIQNFLPTTADFINNETIQSQLTDYQDKYQSLYQAQKDLKNGLMTGSTRKTFLDKFPDLAKYAGNTEDLSSAIDDLMDSMDSDVTNQFTDAIEALRDAGEDANADALQKYVDDVIAGAHDIEGAYKKIAGLKIPTPQYEAAKDASSTENGGATYDDMLSMYNTAKEAYEKGLVGTDDFKTTAAMFSPTGSDDYANFAENMSKIEKYFTEGSDGCINFLNDLQALGLAEQENGNWTYSLGNNMEELKETADKLGIGFEPLMSVFGKLEDYGFYNDFFTTEEAGTEKISDLYSKLAAEKMHLAQIKANPNTEDYDTALSESERKIAEFEERIKNANANMDELVDKKGKYTKEQTDYAKSVAKTMIDDINNTDDVQLKEVLQKQLDSFAKDYHLIIDVDGNITSLEEQIDTIEPDVEINLSATGDDLDSEISDLSKYLQGLRESSDIDVNTDKISAAETILKTLIERKQELEAPAVMNISDDQLNSVNADLQNAITAIQNYQTAVNELDKQKSLGLDTSDAQKAVNDAKAELDSIDDETKKTLKFDIQGLDDAGIQDAINKLDLSAFDDGIQQLTYHFNIDNEEDANAFLDKIAGLPKDTQKITVSVNLDNTSRQTLSLINSTVSKLQSSNPSLSVSVSAKNLQSQATEQSSIPIDGNNTPYKKSVDEAKKYAENQKPEMKIDGNKGPAISAANAAVEEINNKTANINVGANISSMVSTIQAELNKPHSVNVTANVTTNVKNNSGGTGGGFASGTMLRVAHASGTAYNVLNYSPAHADGNVALQSNEKALVNELPDGPESIVRDGKWMVIPGGAHFENLKKGDIIFNSKQTSELINSGRVMSGGGHARALAGGTVHSGMSAFLDGSPKGGGNSFGLNKGNQSSPSNSTITDKNTISVKKNTDTVNDNTEKVKKSTKVYNWVETRIKHWSDQVQKIADKITDYIKKSLKTSLLKQQIRKMNYEIGSNQKGAKTYMKKANSIANEYTYYNSDGEEIKTNVPKKYQKLVQKGAYRIEDMDTSTDQGKALAEAIDQYKTYYDKAQDCKQAVVDLKKEQMELFEQWANMPTETAEQKLERLQNGFNGLNATQSRLSAVQTGGSTQKAIADAATASYESAQVVTEKAQSNLDTATAKADKATTAVNRKKKALLKSKGLTNEQKKAIKSGKTIDTSKITNKTTKKRAEEYNSAVKNKKKADSKKKTAQTKFNTANKNSSSLKTDAETAIAGYQEGNELSYMDSLTDQNVTQTKQAADINNKAWEETKKNLNAQEKAKKQADDKVSKKAKAIKKKFGSKLSDNQKKKLAAGKEINVDKIKDKSLKKALTAYNKYVTTAAETEQKLNIVTDAESTAAANAAESQTEAAKATVEAIQSKFDNAKTYYEGLLGYQEKYNEMEEANIDLYNAHGNYERSSDYEIKISNTESLRNIAQDKVDELEKRLQEGVDNGTIVEGSQEWINMKSEIIEAKKAVTDYDTSIENLKQQQIGVYYEEQFDRAIEKIDQFKDRLDTLNEIISDDMKVDKNTGLLTELGATSVMLNRNQFSANQKEIQKLLEKENDVKKRYANGEDMSSEFGEKTYDEYIKDIQSKYNSLISSNSSLQNDMLSLVKNQAQAELDALNKVISKRKEALSAKKDYYDYDKTLKDKTKDIQILERQAAALQGSTNAEDKARLAKIQEQLSDAREDLSDTMTDHAFSMQSDALDKLSSDMSDDFDKWSNDISSNVEKMSKAINEAVSNSALSNAQVLNNLSTILKNVGLTDEQVSSTLSGLTGYASGTDYVPKSGMYRVNENGMESVLSRKYGTLTFLNQGDKIFTADFTKRLIDNAGIATQSSQPQFGEMYKELMNAITNTNNQSYEHSTVYNIVVNEATDANAVGDIVVKKIDAYEKKRVRDFKSLR
nr:MAG TPA: chromosome segregation protein [Bacteriophage sp.]